MIPTMRSRASITGSAPIFSRHMISAASWMLKSTGIVIGCLVITSEAGRLSDAGERASVGPVDRRLLAREGVPDVAVGNDPHETVAIDDRDVADAVIVS